jgi:iron complex outermembrane receptor protein
MEDLATNSPNLDIKGSRGTGNVSPTYQIRGISGGGGATGERGVGFYLDNVFIPRQTGPYMQVLDLERVEVLRGPQGTLFGRNSLGGAIRVFSKQPTQEKDGYVQVTGGNFDRRDVSVMFNTPVSDTLAIRAQAAYMDQDGYVTRGPQELGSSENLILRLRAAWEASDNVSVSFGAMHLDSKSDGNPQDLETFDMAPVDPINGVSDVISFEGGYADWMSDFLEASGQSRLRNNDERLLLDDYTMPDFCFLDDANPDWDDLCLQVNENTYTQLDTTVNWTLSDTLSMTSTTGYSEFDSTGITD